ncbi:MAG: hypothetical protein UEB92_05755 [Clostridia bacterium]|nr:hypothetical protein [Clostridia bacterium]
MIKTVNGRTKARGSNTELLMDFIGTAEAILKKTKITAEQLHQAIKLAEMTNEVVEKIGECFDDFDVEEPETENESAEEKTTAKKGAVKATVLEADDLDGMLELLKGELEELKERFDD